jgi:hypothetical protein
MLAIYVTKLGAIEKYKAMLNLYKYNGKFFNIVFNYLRRNKIKPDNGFAPLNKILDASLNTKTYQTPYYKGFSQLKIAALKNIAEQCSKNGISLYVVFAPYYNNGYFNKIETDALLNQLSFLDKKQLINIADINTVPLLKASNYWKDDRHLNKDGALLFSTLLNDSLLLRK